MMYKQIVSAWVIVLAIFCGNTLSAKTFSGANPIAPKHDIALPTDIVLYKTLDIQGFVKKFYPSSAELRNDDGHAYGWYVWLDSGKETIEMNGVARWQYGESFWAVPTGYGKNDWVAINFDEFKYVFLPVLVVPSDKYDRADLVAHAAKNLMAGIKASQYLMAVNHGITFKTTSKPIVIWSYNTNADWMRIAGYTQIKDSTDADRWLGQKNELLLLDSLEEVWEFTRMPKPYTTQLVMAPMVNDGRSNQLPNYAGYAARGTSIALPFLFINLYSIEVEGMKGIEKPTSLHAFEDLYNLNVPTQPGWVRHQTYFYLHGMGKIFGLPEHHLWLSKSSEKALSGLSWMNPPSAYPITLGDPKGNKFKELKFLDSELDLIKNNPFLYKI